MAMIDNGGLSPLGTCRLWGINKYAQESACDCQMVVTPVATRVDRPHWIFRGRIGSKKERPIWGDLRYQGYQAYTRAYTQGFTVPGIPGLYQGLYAGIYGTRDTRPIPGPIRRDLRYQGYQAYTRAYTQGFTVPGIPGLYQGLYAGIYGSYCLTSV